MVTVLVHWKGAGALFQKELLHNLLNIKIKVCLSNLPWGMGGYCVGPLEWPRTPMCKGIALEIVNTTIVLGRFLGVGLQFLGGGLLFWGRG